MIDRRALITPGDLVLECDTPLIPFRNWAEATHSMDGRIWMQLNHPGRHPMVARGDEAIAPWRASPKLGEYCSLFAPPQEISDVEIADVIERFAVSAWRAEEAGFDGVEIHAGQGHLLSQFLSPYVNRRQDEWGGGVENRARLLLAVLAAVRGRVSKNFAVAVKLDTPNFDSAGSETDDLRKVLELLKGSGLDLIELASGGFQSSVPHRGQEDQSVRDRPVRSREFAATLKSLTSVPIMVSGGVCARASAEAIISEGIEMVGLATALVFEPYLPVLWQLQEHVVERPALHWKNEKLANAAWMGVVRRIFHRLGKDVPTGRALSPLLSLVMDRFRRKALLKRYRDWLASRAA
jgi:2,4-dienoyl-CoA reductase-like NADH-dependent reductase (Old Yellow Enzyme family)